jgi:hypothetical protein
MRTRAGLGVLTGALALSTLAVPAAQADNSYGDTKIIKVVVDGDDKVVFGTGAKKFKVEVTATDDSGIEGAERFDLYGPDFGMLRTGTDEHDKPSCVAVNDTTSTCTGWVTVDPRADYLYNAQAGTWRVEAWVDAKDKDWAWKESAGTFQLQRHTRLSVNAAPEPVRKGGTVTVTGKLTRVDWEALTYGGHGGQYVKLQYQKRGASGWSTLKTVKSTSTGYLKTTTTATYDGSYRFVYAGSPTSAAVTAAADYVDVQ